MNQDEKRELENELVMMGLPALDTAELIQVIADMINAHPRPHMRVDFFCKLLNQCVGDKRREMYDALRPRLHFTLPALDVCEARIAARAERLIRPEGRIPAHLLADEERKITVHCGNCGIEATFAGASTADARANAHKAGWGRGPKKEPEWCPECRLATMPAKPVAESLTRRLGHAVEA